MCSGKWERDLQMYWSFGSTNEKQEQRNTICFFYDIVLCNTRNILSYLKEFNLKSYQIFYSEIFLLWQLHENILRMILLKRFLVKSSTGSLGGVFCTFLQAVIGHKRDLSNVNQLWMEQVGQTTNKSCERKKSASYFTHHNSWPTALVSRGFLLSGLAAQFW